MPIKIQRMNSDFRLFCFSSKRSQPDSNGSTLLLGQYSKDYGKISQAKMVKLEGLRDPSMFYRVEVDRSILHSKMYSRMSRRDNSCVMYRMSRRDNSCVMYQNNSENHVGVIEFSVEDQGEKVTRYALITRLVPIPTQIEMPSYKTNLDHIWLYEERK